MKYNSQELSATSNLFREVSRFALSVHAAGHERVQVQLARAENRRVLGVQMERLDGADVLLLREQRGGARLSAVVPHVIVEANRNLNAER